MGRWYQSALPEAELAAARKSATHADKTRDAATRTRCTSMCTHHIRLLGTYNEQKTDSLVLDVDRRIFMLYYAEKNDHRDVLNDRLPQHIA